MGAMGSRELLSDLQTILRPRSARSPVLGPLPIYLT